MCCGPIEARRSPTHSSFANRFPQRCAAAPLKLHGDGYECIRCISFSAAMRCGPIEAWSSACSTTHVPMFSAAMCCGPTEAVRREKRGVRVFRGDVIAAGTPVPPRATGDPPGRPYIAMVVSLVDTVVRGLSATIAMRLRRSRIIPARVPRFDQGQYRCGATASGCSRIVPRHQAVRCLVWSACAQRSHPTTCACDRGRCVRPRCVGRGTASPDRM